MTEKNHISERQEQLETLLKEALSRPGVSEYMEVYGEWEEQDRRLDPYRMATKDIIKVSTTDHANVLTLPA